MERPANLTPAAERDLLWILEDTFDRFGPRQMDRTEARLLARCASIERGHTIGHSIASISTKRPLLFHYEKPWMIAFDAKTRDIINIVHGRRDIAALLR